MIIIDAHLKVLSKMPSDVPGHRKWWNMFKARTLETKISSKLTSQPRSGHMWCQERFSQVVPESSGGKSWGFIQNNPKSTCGFVWKQGNYPKIPLCIIMFLIVGYTSIHWHIGIPLFWTSPCVQIYLQSGWFSLPHRLPPPLGHVEQWPEPGHGRALQTNNQLCPISKNSTYMWQKIRYSRQVLWDLSSLKTVLVWWRRTGDDRMIRSLRSDFGSKCHQPM